MTAASIDAKTGMMGKVLSKPGKWLLGTICLGVTALIGLQFYALSWNFSPSVPYTLFLVTKGAVPTHKGEFVVFKFPGKNFFKPEDRFVKKVVGMVGDRVETQGRDVFVNGEKIATAKEKSMQGVPLAALDYDGLIPANKLFVLGMSKDSYDSRYQDVGLVDEARVVGTAIPIF